MIQTDDDSAKLLTVHAMYGRDAGKAFQIREINPLSLSGYVLELVSALRVESYEAMMDDFKAAGEKDGGAPIDAVMKVLRGADPKAVHALITELVNTYVSVAPDPKHPGALRPLMPSDIREIRTLGEILVAFAKLHFAF
jgi:hypothetical protein